MGHLFDGEWAGSNTRHFCIVIQWSSFNDQLQEKGLTLLLLYCVVVAYNIKLHVVLWFEVFVALYLRLFLV